MGYLGNHSIGVNVKHGKLQIELAVEGWYLATNTVSTAKKIEEGLEFAKEEGKSNDLETRVEDIAYDVYGRVTDGKAIYFKGKNVMLAILPTIPEEVV